MPRAEARRLEGFDDPALSVGVWERLLRRGGTDVVFLTEAWQRTWWDAFARGELLLVGAWRDGEIVALAPLFADGEMGFFVGAGGSDYLDFIGESADPDVLSALLATARDEIPDFVGFRFHHVPDASPTPPALSEVARRLDLVRFEEGDQIAPYLDLAARPEAAAAAAGKRSLLRHERYFEREGGLCVRHLRGADEILPHLDAFFDQHVARWTGTPHPSLFEDPAQRAFYRRLVSSEPDWLRFTRIAWQKRPIAFHFGFCYRGSFLWYKPSFAIDLARRSPGEVLIRQLLLAASDEGARVFDLGLGDESFKDRFATDRRRVRDWGLYPRTSLRNGSVAPQRPPT